MRIRSVATPLTGGAGVATGTSSFGIGPSRLLGVQVLLNGQPATVDLTVANMGRNVVNLTNIAADKFYPVREKVTDATGTLGAAGDNLWTPAILHGDVTLSWAQGNADTVGPTVVFFVADVGA